jgi:hypothetical protein
MKETRLIPTTETCYAQEMICAARFNFPPPSNRMNAAATVAKLICREGEGCAAEGSNKVL